MNALISVDTRRASFSDTLEPSKVITVSIGARVMVRCLKRTAVSPRIANEPSAPSTVFNSSDSMRGILTPQSRIVSSYCTSSPRSVRP